MKVLLLERARVIAGILLMAAAMAMPCRAAEPAAQPALASSVASTNGMLVVCEDGVIFSNSIPLLVFNKNVRVLDRQSDTYLECDRLTLTFQTNVTKQAGTNRAPVLDASGIAGIAGQTNENTRLDAIFAEGHVMIVTRDQQVLGDRVVYTSTNDVMVVTGEMVILASPQGVGLGHRVVFDRGAGVFRGEGPFAFDGFAPGGTNRAALLPGRGTGTNATNTVPAKIPSPPLRPAPGRK